MLCCDLARTYDVLGHAKKMFKLLFFAGFELILVNDH